MKNERPTWCHLLFCFTSYVLSMFQTLIYPSSGACDCRITTSVVLFSVRCVLELLVRLVFCGVRFAGFNNKSSNTQRTENKTTDVVIHQHSRKLLKMDILMSETCWAHNKWNKIASDIQLAFHSSITAMMHGPINIRFYLDICTKKDCSFNLYSRIFLPPAF